MRSTVSSRPSGVGTCRAKLAIQRRFPRRSCCCRRQSARAAAVHSDQRPNCDWFPKHNEYTALPKIGTRAGRLRCSVLDLARGEVLTGGLVRLLREPPDELLEHVAHRQVADDIRVEVDVREPGDDLLEQARLVQLLDLVGETEPGDRLERPRGEPGDVGGEVRTHVLRVVLELAERQRGDVVEALPAVRRSTGSTLSIFPASATAFATTTSFVGSSTQSSRRSTVSGRMTLPYSDCL